MATERLNRYLSLAASVSRRVADEMVRNGRVTVGGVPVLDPGTLWDPSTQEVRLAQPGQRLGDDRVAARPVGLHQRDVGRSEGALRRRGVQHQALVDLAADAPGSGEIDEHRLALRGQLGQHGLVVGQPRAGRRSDAGLAARRVRRQLAWPAPCQQADDCRRAHRPWKGTRSPVAEAPSSVFGTTV